MLGERIYSQLRAIEVLEVCHSFDQPATMKLNARGRRMLAYLSERRRRRVTTGTDGCETPVPTDAGLTGVTISRQRS